jgi:hypothetical protein
MVEEYVFLIVFPRWIGATALSLNMDKGLVDGVCVVCEVQV